MGGYSTGSRAAADLAQPAPWSPSDRWSGPSGRSGPSVRSPAVLLGGAPTISADIQQEWFQQDSVTPHTPAASRLWLQERFPGRVISLKEEVQWAPHSPDLSPLDFFLWGYLKDRVYKDKPRTSEQLKRTLIAEVSVMPSEMVDRAVDHLQTATAPGDPPGWRPHRAPTLRCCYS